MKTFYSHRDDVWGASRWLADVHKLTQVDDPMTADVVVWNGGEDIATSLYNEQPISRYIPRDLSRRDKEELELFERVKDRKDVLLLGICRGAQLLNCLSGGTLYQDVDRHGRDHLMIDTRSGEILQTTSVHHQQCRVDPHTGQVLAVAAESTYQSAEGVVNHPNHTTQNLMGGQDVEVFYYPDTRALCIQGHPEYVPGSKFSNYCWGLMQEFFPTKAA